MEPVIEIVRSGGLFMKLDDLITFRHDMPWHGTIVSTHISVHWSVPGYQVRGNASRQYHEAMLRGNATRQCNRPFENAQESEIEEDGNHLCVHLILCRHVHRTKAVPYQL